MHLRCLSGTDIAALLPMPKAIEAMRDAYVALCEGRIVAPQRQVVSIEPESAVNLLMGGYVPGERLATKIVSVFPGNAGLDKPVIQGLVVVQDETSGEPIAILDGTFLTSWRTGAAAGIATDLLARSDARSAALIGCGAQAPAQLLALDAVREFEIVRLYNRSPDRALELAERMSTEVNAELVVVESVDDAVRSADVVTCVTSATEPVLLGAALAAGCHINAMGSFTLAMRELDEAAVGRCRVFVDKLEAALAEAGELVAAEEKGTSNREGWTELGRVATGEADGRSSPDQITLFKSVGQAAQDVVSASRIVGAAQAADRGVVVEL